MYKQMYTRQRKLFGNKIKVDYNNIIITYLTYFYLRKIEKL